MIKDLDFFGPVSAVYGGGASNDGRLRLHTRLMPALPHLKHAFNESDEYVIQRWDEMPTWQYFSGNQYFEHQSPCDHTQLMLFTDEELKLLKKTPSNRACRRKPEGKPSH